MRLRRKRVPAPQQRRRDLRHDGAAMRSSPTSLEVAQLAGVSRSAVSRAFSPTASVAPETRRRVLEAAAKIAYEPNVIARSLITRRSRMVGLIMGEWENPFYTTMLRGFSEKLQARGYQLMLLARAPDGDVGPAVRLLLQYRVDGIVLVSCALDARLGKECARRGTRIVVVSANAPARWALNVESDNLRVGREVAQRLLQAGYERMAIVRGNPTARPGVLRTSSFMQTIAASDRARVVLEETGIVGYEAGRRFAARVLGSPARPDAIFCSSDLTALGVLDAARLEARLHVPDELAVVGHGDVPAAAWAAYALTTVRIPVERLIDASIDGLLAARAPSASRPVTVEAALIERATVRAARRT